jgi:hypothetical protein
MMTALRYKRHRQWQPAWPVAIVKALGFHSARAIFTGSALEDTA